MGEQNVLEADFCGFNTLKPLAYRSNTAIPTPNLAAIMEASRVRFGELFTPLVDPLPTKPVSTRIHRVQRLAIIFRAFFRSLHGLAIEDGDHHHDQVPPGV